MPISLPSLPSWSTTKTTSKQGFDKVYNFVDRLGPPVNKVTNKIGSEAFWPTTLDKESHKAARILRSFCKDGFYLKEENGSVSTTQEPNGNARVANKIPTEVVRNAKGLAIFTTMRTGLWVSGAGGSGILVARTSTGEWSPPSGILLHTAGLGFLVGVDIYDCVLVINTDEALEAFKNIRCTIGGEISAVAGPVGVGGILETEIHKRQAPVWNYLKSRGFYAGVQIDGTVLIERGDENERFYGERVSAADILAGKVRHPPYETRSLIATLEAAQGDPVEESALPPLEPTPSDMDIEKPEVAPGFGLPAEDDPDPFGVKALEHEGFEIKEAGTNRRPSMEAFEYKPSPTSPIYSSFRRHSIDSARRNSKRSSVRSIASTDRGTQTADLEMSPTKSKHSESRNTSPIHSTSEGIAEDVDGEKDQETPKGGHPDVIPEAAAPVISKARLVTIPRRTLPSLPPRNPQRNASLAIDAGTDGTPYGSQHADRWTDVRIPSPLKDHEPGHVLEQSLDDTNPARPFKAVDHITYNPNWLTPNHDGFDEISMSDSDYSREAPIAMKDNEADSSTKKHDGTMYGKGSNMSEEFHSMPSTPLEAAVPPLHGGRDTQKSVS